MPTKKRKLHEEREERRDGLIGSEERIY